MGKFVLGLVSLSFAAFILLLFKPGDFLFSNIRLQPEALLGSPLPSHFEVEQALASADGDIVIGIDRKHEMRIHIVQTRTQSNPTTVGNTEVSGTIQLIEQSKIFKASKGQTSADFLTRYLSAQIDPRRVSVQSIHPVSVNKTPLGELPNNVDTQIVLATSKKHHWYGIVYVQAVDLLVIASHPHEEIQLKQFMDSLAQVGFILHLSSSNLE